MALLHSFHHFWSSVLPAFSIPLFSQFLPPLLLIYLPLSLSSLLSPLSLSSLLIFLDFFLTKLLYPRSLPSLFPFLTFAAMADKFLDGVRQMFLTTLSFFVFLALDITDLFLCPIFAFFDSFFLQRWHGCHCHLPQPNSQNPHSVQSDRKTSNVAISVQNADLNTGNELKSLPLSQWSYPAVSLTGRNVMGGIKLWCRIFLGCRENSIGRKGRKEREKNNNAVSGFQVEEGDNHSCSDGQMSVASSVFLPRGTSLLSSVRWTDCQCATCRAWESSGNHLYVHVAGREKDGRASPCGVYRSCDVAGDGPISSAAVTNGEVPGGVAIWAGEPQRCGDNLEVNNVNCIWEIGESDEGVGPSSDTILSTRKCAQMGFNGGSPLMYRGVTEKSVVEGDIEEEAKCERRRYKWGIGTFLRETACGSFNGIQQFYAAGRAAQSWDNLDKAFLPSSERDPKVEKEILEMSDSVSDSTSEICFSRSTVSSTSSLGEFDLSLNKRVTSVPEMTFDSDPCFLETNSSSLSIQEPQMGPLSDPTLDDKNVLFIHGFLCSSSFWVETVLPHFSYELQSSHRLYSVDLLGFGQSPKPRNSSYTMEEQVSWIEHSVLERFNVGQFHIVAHSLGCIVALAIAARHVDRIRSITLISPPYVRTPAGMDPSEAYFKHAAVRTIWPPLQLGMATMAWYEHVGRVVCWMVCGGHRIWEPLATRIVSLLGVQRVWLSLIRDFARHTHIAAWRTFHNGVCGGLRTVDPSLAILRSNGKEVSIFHGTDDPVCPFSGSVELSKTHVNVTVNVVPRADHVNIVVGREKELAKKLENIILSHR